MILGFMVWWPLGLAVLAFAIGSGRMGCWKGHGMSRWHQAAGARNGRHVVAAAATVERQPRLRRISHRDAPRLEDEQREFHDFLDRLRMAKDKSEFDQFMAERRNRARSGRSATELISERHCVSRLS